MRTALTLMLLLFALSADAAAPTAVPLTVEADSMEYLGKEGHSVFKSNVVVTGSGYTLKADTMDLYLNSDREVERIICKNNVTFNTQDLKSRSKSAMIDQLKKIITLTGAVTIQKGKSVITGEIVKINYETSDIIIDRGASERMSVTFEPTDPAK